MSSVSIQEVSQLRCGSECRFVDRLASHHDQLLAVEETAEALLDLLELAVTWGELEYASVAVIPPAQWLDFVSQHRWHDRDHAERIFSLAADVAMHSEACAASVRAHRRPLREMPVAGSATTSSTW